MSSAVASQAGQVLREIFKIPSRAREQVGQSWRTRFWQTERSKKEILITSLNIHQPIWIAGTAGAYTSAYACLMVMRCLRKVRP